jgi:hypothetical protein
MTNSTFETVSSLSPTTCDFSQDGHVNSTN